MNLTALAPLAKVHMSGQQTVAILILLVIFGGWMLYTILAALKRDPGEPAGSETELAPNRKPYFDDDELEGPRLDRALLFAFGMLCLIAIALPLYWFREPGRSRNEQARFMRASVSRGSGLFSSTKVAAAPQSFESSGIHMGCVECHGTGGGGGQRTFVLPALGKNPPATVTWQVPPLNTVLYRFKEDDSTTPAVDMLKQIIVYGRPGTPMPAWGLNGGGSLDDQQINDLVNYISSIQLSPADARKYWDDQATQVAKEENLTYPNANPLINGKILFDTNCARCHTQGWSYAIFPNGVPTNPATGLPLVEGGGGQYAPNITGGSERRQFTDTDTKTGEQAQIDFVSQGVDPGKGYGNGGIQTDYGGGMPHFGVGPDCPLCTVPSTGVAGQGYLSDQEIKEIVDYERSL